MHLRRSNRPPHPGAQILQARHPPPAIKIEVITYTLLVGSFPFAGRDGDSAMLARIAAGR